MDAVNGEAVLAARQSASQARCSAHPPSRPWRVGRALQEQGQPYSTLQREYLPSLTGEPPLPHNAHYRQPHRCVHGSRQLALRFTARLCGGCAAAPCRAEPQTGGGSGLWSVPTVERIRRRSGTRPLLCLRRCVTLCRRYAMASPSGAYGPSAVPSPRQCPMQTVRCRPQAMQRDRRKAMRPTRPVRIGPSPDMHRTSHRGCAATPPWCRTTRRSGRAFRPPSRPVSTWSTPVGAPSVRHHSHRT